MFDILRDRNAALCIADVDDVPLEAHFVATADYGYLRLRCTTYGEGEIRALCTPIVGQPWGDVFAYFKHEDTGPELAATLISLSE